METLKQTIMVPQSHQLHLNITLPENFPTGPAEVILVFASQEATTNSTQKNKLLSLAGSLKNSPHFSGDPLVIQRNLRDEWQD